jgi:hypothetical protein
MMPIDFCISRTTFAALLSSISLYCCSYQVETPEETYIALNDDEHIAVVGYSGVPEGILKCVSSSIQPAIPVIPGHEFQDALFPWFEPSTTPHTQPQLEKLLAREQAVTALAELKIRYVVAIGGGTVVKGGSDCLDTLTGSICAGAWDHSTHLAATVLDPQEKSVIEAVDAKVEGTAWYVLLVIIPLGAPALTETAACDEVAQRLIEAFSLPPSKY